MGVRGDGEVGVEEDEEDLDVGLGGHTRTLASGGWDAGAMRAEVGQGTASHEERLWPGPLGWASVIGFAVVVAVALVPVDVAIGAGVGLVVLAAGVVAAVRTSPVVAVRDGELVAGRAHIPVRHLGAGRTLDADGVRAALGPGSDARTYVCLRAWVPGGVVLPVTDPQDPTPSWLVSSRRPAALLAAVEAARGEGQAHSEQMG